MRKFMLKAVLVSFNKARLWTIRERDEPCADSIGLSERVNQMPRGAASLGARMLHRFCGDNYQQFE